jgi:hypothetical protein
MVRAFAKIFGNARETAGTLALAPGRRSSALAPLAPGRRSSVLAPLASPDDPVTL